MFNYNKTQLVELVVPANDGRLRFNFPTQNFLRYSGIKINSIETFSANDLSLSAQGNILPTEANLKSAYVTFYGDQPDDPGAMGDWLQEIPLWSLHRMSNNTDPYVRDLFTLIPRNIVWEKSSITLGAALANGSQLSFVFNVGYEGVIPLGA